MLETGQYHKLAGRGKKKADMDKYTNKSEIKIYNSAADSTLPVKTEEQPTSSKKKKVCDPTIDVYNTHYACIIHMDGLVLPV